MVLTRFELVMEEQPMEVKMAAKITIQDSSGSWLPLWSPDSSLEPQDEAISW